MKVKIGPYPNWFGPYQLCDLLRFVGVSKEKRRNLASKINEKPFQWFHDTFQKRKVKIRIDYYDVWGMDHTLAVIILPMLKLLKEKKHGSPFVDDIDVPPELRSDVEPAEDEYGTDGKFHERWEWVMNEMIFAFEKIVNDDWESELILNNKWEEHRAIQNRMQNGFRLFGVYFTALWD